MSDGFASDGRSIRYYPARPSQPCQGWGRGFESLRPLQRSAADHPQPSTESRKLGREKRSLPVRHQDASFARGALHPSIPAQPANPSLRTALNRSASMPPRAITGTPNPRPIRAARAAPSTGAPGCERVANTGDTNNSSAPACTPLSASRRLCADQVRNPPPTPCPCTPSAPGSSPPALMTMQPRARARLRTATNSRARAAGDSA